MTQQVLQRRQRQRAERIANETIDLSGGQGTNIIDDVSEDDAYDDDDDVQDVTIDLSGEDGTPLDQFYRDTQGEPLQALTFEKSLYNTKVIMYTGKVPRFNAKTGVIRYMKLKRYKTPKRGFFTQWYESPVDPDLKYSGEKFRIKFEVKWDNKQLRDSVQSQFNEKEFDYLMANLKDEMKEIDQVSMARSNYENQLIPIDELNFQKEMYNKDTSTLVVAEASASKPGLSPVSIPSGELSAMLAELSSMDNTESEYASESEVEEPLETGWKSDDFASSDFASESGDNSSELSN